MDNDFPEVNEGIRRRSWPVSGVPTDDFSPELNIKPGPRQTVRIPVNKATHAVRYDGETEHEVVIVIGPKE